MGLSIAALAVSLVVAVVAIYAAVISRQALAWQKQQDQARITPDVRVELEHATQAAHPLVEWVGNAQRPRALEYRITINVVNDGQRPEHLKRLWVETEDGSEGYDARPVGSDEVIEPRARHKSIVPLESIPNWQAGFRAIATMAGGEQFSSPLEHARSDLLADIARHNEGVG
jgi:hypothetical protein